MVANISDNNHILAIVFNSNIDSSFGYDIVGMFGDAIWLELLAAVSIWIISIFIFWISAISFLRLGCSCRLFKVETQTKNKSTVKED